MLISKRLLSVTIAISGLLNAQAQAGVVLGFSEAVYEVSKPAPGLTTQFTITGTIAANPGTTQPMTGYSLPVDFAAPAYPNPGIPDGWTIASVQPILNLNNFMSNPPSAEIDLYPRDFTTGAPVSLTDSAIPLFNITITLNDRAQEGLYSASFLNLIVTSISTDSVGGELPRNDIVTGSAAINVVPEPTGVSFYLASILGCCAFRRVRRPSMLG